MCSVDGSAAVAGAGWGATAAAVVDAAAGCMAAASAVRPCWCLRLLAMLTRCPHSLSGSPALPMAAAAPAAVLAARSSPVFDTTR